MDCAGAWLDHDRLPGREIADRKNSVRLYPQILGESAVLGNAVGAQIQTEQEVAAQTVKAFATGFVTVADHPLPFLQIFHIAPEGNEFSSKLVTRDQREARGEFSFVNVEVGAAEPAGIDSNQDII
jgi:hypothetical protein